MNYQPSSTKQPSPYEGRSRSGWWLLSPWTIAVGLFVMLSIGIGAGVGIGASVWNTENEHIHPHYHDLADWYAVSPPVASATGGGQRLLYFVHSNWTVINIYYQLYDTLQEASDASPTASLHATGSHCWNPVPFLQGVHMSAYPMGGGMWQLVSAPQDLQPLYLAPGSTGGLIWDCNGVLTINATGTSAWCPIHVDPATGKQAVATPIYFSNVPLNLQPFLAEYFQSPFHLLDVDAGLCYTELAPFFHMGGETHSRVMDAGSVHFMSLPSPEGANKVVETTSTFHLNTCSANAGAASFRPGASGTRQIVARDIWPIV